MSASKPPIVVGIDGSAAREPALGWALGDAAAARNWAVRRPATVARRRQCVAAELADQDRCTDPDLPRC
jgi:hypothetical protein